MNVNVINPIHSSSECIPDRSANHLDTFAKSYPREVRCFSPDSTPGVSMMLTCRSSGADTIAAQNLFRNPDPKELRPLKGKSVTPIQV